WDNWPSNGTLANRVQLQRKPGSTTVRHLFHNNRRDQDSLRHILPENLVQEVIQTDIGNIEDRENVTQLETLDHLFTTSDLAIKVWNYMTRPLGIIQNVNTVHGAALQGIEWCHENSNSPLILELDTLIAVNMIKGLTQPPIVSERQIL
ncbi:hypothetical protein HAX54_008095, partial [Datura stramonium]|nr:hypothetical protein [Datura stramonium]